MLSRLPAGPDQFFDDQQSLNVVVNQIQDSQVRDSSVSAIEVQKATKAAPVLQKHQEWMATNQKEVRQAITPQLSCPN